MSTSKLSSAALASIRQYFTDQARPLEQALVAHRLDNASPKAVFEALAKFQNPDGGFGRGLEPDLRSPSSSPFQTSVAFQTLRELDAPGDHPMVTAALQYLRDVYDKDSWSWPVTPKDVEDHPHAPWWRAAAATPSSENLNPRAELLGVLLHYRACVDDGWVSSIEEAVRMRLEACEELEMHELLCVIRLAETKSISGAWREALKKQILKSAAACVGTDQAAWEGYGLRPVDVAPDPEGLIGDEYAAAGAAFCDYLIETVHDGGYWEPAWSWAEHYPDAWEVAVAEWRGVLAAKNLQILGAYGRLG